jgi:hypothetical protein
VEPNWTPVPKYESPAFGDFTNDQGVWGLPIGGLLTDVDTGGPLVLWPNAHPDQYADAARKVGWYPMTDHLTPNPEWMYVTKPGTTPPPSTSEVKLVMVVNGVEQDLYIPFQSGAAPQDSMALALKQGDTQTHHIRWVQGPA